LAPGLLLLLSLPRPPGGSVLVSPLAQFSMSPDKLAVLGQLCLAIGLFPFKQVLG
jgi:hypothetical protein